MLGIRTPEPFRANDFQDRFLDQPDTCHAKHPVEECFTTGINPVISSMEMESNHPNPKATVLQTVPLPLTVYPSKK